MSVPAERARDASRAAGDPLRAAGDGLGAGGDALRAGGDALRAAGRPAVECVGLTRDYPVAGGRVRALDGVDLEVPRGAVFGFLGPNGAGKTTTIRLLLGLLAPTAGSVAVLGHRLPEGGAEIRRRTGTVLDHPGLYEGLRVRTTLEFAAGAHGLSPRAAARRTDEVAEQLGLARRLDERPATLSRGLRQRFAIARALLGRPELLVLDEPTNGLDPSAAAALRGEIGELAAAGTTVFLTTHLLAEAERVCDLVAVVAGGQVRATGTPAALRRGATVRGVRIEGTGVAEAAERRLGPPGAEGGALEGWIPAGSGAVRVGVRGLEAIGEVVSALVAEGAAIHRVEPEGQTLEAAYLELVDGPALDVAAALDEPTANGVASAQAQEPTGAPRAAEQLGLGR